MKKWLLFVILAMTICLVCACNKESEENNSLDPVWLEVEPAVHPEHPKANEKVTLKAVVTYGDKKVDDANDVKFEIWRAKDEKHKTVKPKNAGDGVYQYETSFDREGTYYFIAHVTAENMHNMPKTEFVVGKASDPEEDPSSTTMEESDEHTEK